MSRTYINSDGMSVEVTEEHLDHSVDVKIKLQNTSPSRRCNWNTHKKIMKELGFDDSDKNESYRCLVKSYQKKIGKLHNLSTYADLVSSSKLESIKNAVGDFRFEKQSNQDLLREINKIYRDMTRTAVAVEELKNAYIDDIDFSVPHYVYNPILPTTSTKGIVIITDWHIGVVVDDCLGNNYNYEIAIERIEMLKREVINYCKLFNINDLHVIGLGDWIEHLYMRKNQSQDCEFSPSKQIAKAQKLIFNFIVSLSEYVNVTYGGIAGNHDRFEADKGYVRDDDNANVIITEGIKDMVNLLNTDRIKLLDLSGEETEIKLNVNGKKFKFTHGHLEDGNKKHRMKSHISMDNEFYDCWVHGHLHNFYQEEDDHSRQIVGVGCLMGRNNYSKKISCATDASQGFIIVRGDGDIKPMKINLQN